MDHLSRNQITETYLMSGLSLFCVLLFVFIKSNLSWWQEKYLRSLMAGWVLLDLVALILFAVQHSQRTQLLGALSGSLHIILDTISMWGVAIIQIPGIIYLLAVPIKIEAWVKWIAILECAAVTSIVIVALVPGIPTPRELAYIVPFTSQAAVVGLVFYESSVVKRVPKTMTDHLLFLGLFLIAVSTVLLMLSLAGRYERLMFPQWLLYMTISTISYRLPEYSHQSPDPVDGDLEIELRPASQPTFSHSPTEDSTSPNLAGH
ncbi:hypothetical protein FALBO_3029 [Fusarium albosuccineum]|uniref:Uncharacterized protein n=1 Tax=Fusarium albosuccineum TaxID=1237068 RepID=A0A8H4PEZ9_9HYPO|nr:hypothetical protein FALBO_3029 [Fusarium albosuccineum]